MLVCITALVCVGAIVPTTVGQEHENFRECQSVPGPVRVVLMGLQIQNLNGEGGLLDDFSLGRGRYIVRFDNGKTVRVRPDNVLLADYTAGDLDIAEGDAAFAT